MSGEARQPAGRDPAQAELDARMLSHLRIWLPVGTLAASGAGGVAMGPGVAVLILAFGALIGAITALWWSLRALLGDTPLSGEDAFALAVPSAEEEQKRAVLRAIKDVEFEHSVGKIDRHDHQLLVARYRAEAKRLLRILDDQAAPGRERVEKLVRAHLAAQGLRVQGVDDAASRQPEDEQDSEYEHGCGGCGAGNDDDAVFCKKCGRRLERGDE